MQLFYRETGSGGPAVLILHGLFGMSDNWMTFAKRLATDYHVYLPDLRNHGRSPHSEEMNYNVMAGDVARFIRDTIGRACSVVGHSMGGKVAMKLALEEAELIDSMVSVDIAPKRYHTSQFARFIDVMRAIPTETLNNRGEAERILQEQLMLPAATRQFLLKNLYRDENNQFKWRVNLTALHNHLDALLGGIDSDTRFEKPALFARGSLSLYITEKDTPLIHRLFPNTVIETVPGANHWVHATAPDALEKILRSFWTRHSCK
ncbi:MAG: alpha/beta fold hydrolase [Calditrichaeota bacterium]|nr:MAG: alpha/beta fold hydrolase [Calditrichota bacterium]